VCTSRNSSQLVTETDVAVERMIKSCIAERYPDHGFFGEETYAATKRMTIGKGYTWIVDPIDVSESLTLLMEGDYEVSC